MTDARTDTSPVSASAVLVKDGLVTPYFKRFLDVLWQRTGGYHDLSSTVSTITTASPPQIYTWISNDGGVTWGTTSPQTLTATFYDADAAVVATKAIIGTRDNGTGFVTMTAGAGTGSTVTITYDANNGASQIVTAVLTLNGAVTSLTWQALKDGTALGGYGGGSGPSK